MGREQKRKGISVVEAVDLLSSMVQIDVDKDPKKKQEADQSTIDWTDPKSCLQNQDLVCEVFFVLHRYLQTMVRKDRSVISDPQIQKGVGAIINLSQEAAFKMDRFTALYPDILRPISQLKEYTDLQKYYRQHILGQGPKEREVFEAWEEDLDVKASKDAALESIESVRNDENYELFFILDEGENPYFTRSLLRHVRLIGNFDEVVSKVEGDDPLLSLRQCFDHELYEGAKEAIGLCAPYIDPFYKEAMEKKALPIVSATHKAIMALQMAANSRHLIANASDKSCIEYYSDFHRFLREALASDEYKSQIEQENGKDPFFHLLVRLIHALCSAFFLRIEPKKEVLKHIEQMIKSADELAGKKKEAKSSSFWEEMREKDQNLRDLLKCYPSGPVMRILDSFRDDQEYEGFDPLNLENFPSQLFSLSTKKTHITLLRLPCPTKQLYIHRAKVVEEFMGFLRFYLHELKPDRHLIINLQDRLSQKEFARCKVLEETSRRAEVFYTLYVVGLSKSNSFYLQDEPFQAMGGSEVFLEAFKEQVLGRETHGFRFPEDFSMQKVADFFDEATSVILEVFFEGSSTLSRIERLNFIEIFYLFLILRSCIHLKVDSLSFTCKDGIDVGMGQSALFYGFLRLVFSKGSIGEKDLGMLRHLFYSPALLLRDRLIHPRIFNRSIGALESIEKGISSYGLSKAQKKIWPLFKELDLPFKIS